MKLNFWQWLAIVLLIIGCALWMYERSHPKPTSIVPMQVSPPSTQNTPVP